MRPEDERHEDLASLMPLWHSCTLYQQPVDKKAKESLTEPLKIIYLISNTLYHLASHLFPSFHCQKTPELKQDVI